MKRGSPFSRIGARNGVGWYNAIPAMRCSWSACVCISQFVAALPVSCAPGFVVRIGFVWLVVVVVVVGSVSWPPRVVWLSVAEEEKLRFPFGRHPLRKRRSCIETGALVGGRNV